MRAAAAALLATACLPSPLAKAETGWIRTGPDGAPARQIAVTPSDPNVLWLVATSAVYRSADGGATWVRRSAGLPANPSTTAIAADPATPLVAYVSAGVSGPDQGIFRTTDGGENWQQFPPGEFNHANDFATHPSLPGTVFAGSVGGVYRSDSGGAWVSKRQGLLNSSESSVLAVRALVIAPSNPAVLYVGGKVSSPEGHPLFRSQDAAEHWTPAATGLPRLEVLALAVHATNPDVAYAGLLNGGVYKTVDGGRGWTPLTAGPGVPTIFSLAVDPTSPNRVFAGTSGGGLFRSTNDGATWNRASAGIPFLTILDLRHSVSGALLAGTGGGVFQSIDGGGSFSPRNNGLMDTSVMAMASHPSSPSVLHMAAANSGGAYRSADGGRSWVPFNEGLSASRILDMAVDPNDPRIVYAGSTTGFFRSLDGGRTWALAFNGITDDVTYSLGAGPPGSGVVYAGTQDRGIFRTTSGGETWEPVTRDAGSIALEVDPRSALIVYAVGSSTVHKTTDGGASWTPLSNGLPEFSSWSYHDISADPFHANVVLAAHAEGIYRTVDGGSSWAPANPGLPPPVVPFRYVVDVEYDVARPGVAYAAVFAGASGGVFRSTDGGASWQPFNEGLTDPQVSRLQLTGDGSRLLVGTASGVFLRDLTAVPIPRIPASRQPGTIPRTLPPRG